MYHHRILYFPVMGGVKREGVAGSMFLKKGGYQEGGIKKERGGADTPFRTMDYIHYVPT